MNKTIDSFDLFCFDFDGLLVDSEPLHKRAFEAALKEFGFSHEVEFNVYCAHAHHPTGSQLHSLYQSLFPSINDHFWQKIRQKKQTYYTQFLLTESLSLMPGAQRLITELLHRGKQMAVVTNSCRKHVLPFCQALPILKEIPLWITKDDVQKVKPHPDGYLKALLHYMQIPNDRALGLEDSLKGVTAIKNAGLHPLLVCSASHPQLLLLKDHSLHHVESLETITHD